MALSGEAMYSEYGDVEVLTDANFNSKVLASDDYWIIEFYAPWCGHCKRLQPEWEMAASQLKGIARLGAVDCTMHTNLARQYGIEGYPTIKVFDKDKSNPTDYNGGRTSEDIVNQAKGPSVLVDVSSENLSSFLKHKAPAKVIYFREPDAVVPRWFREMSTRFRFGGDYQAIFTQFTREDEEMVNGFHITTYPTVLACVPTGCVTFEDALTESNVRVFVNNAVQGDLAHEPSVQPDFPGLHSAASSSEPVTQMTKDTWEAMCTESGFKICSILVVDPSNTDLITTYDRISQEYRKDEKFAFSWVSKTDNAAFSDQFGVTSDHPAGLVVLKHTGARKRFAVKQGSLDEGTMKALLDSVLYGDARFGVVNPLAPLEA
eukprot:GFYU01001064.1.p1 GENE.GFYU01001064.1~~GFYU01001064.1.p1  ORF type:complete len:395 (+),score=105.05 GFYU01001064.1:61-1185(+)